MNWYYVVNRERVGPVDSETFTALIKSKKINRETLVWNKTFKDWTRLKNVESEDIPVEELQVSKDPLKDVESEDIPVEEPQVSQDPYIAPKSNIKPKEKSDGDGFTEPSKVPAGNAIKWITRAFSLFLQNPFKWVFILIIGMVLVMIMIIIPIIGPIVYLLIFPVLGAGLLIGAKAQDDGDDLMIKHLFAGFSNNFGQLVLLAFLYFLSALLIMAVIGASMAVFIGMSGMTEFINSGSNPAQFAQNIPLSFIIIFLVATALMIPVIMLYYFGPALISINNISAFDAMKRSFRGCWINFLPFLVYGLIYLVLWLGVVAIIFGFSFIFGSGGNSAVMFVPMIIMGLIGLVATPVGIISIYTSYKDVFYE